jgi:hypothetical protein
VKKFVSGILAYREIQISRKTTNSRQLNIVNAKITNKADRWLLGHAYRSDVVQQLVQGWEQLDWIDEEDIAKACLDRRLSLINRDLGLYLFFTDYASYYERFGEPKSQGSLILSRVVLLLNFHEEYSIYQGALPLDLTLDDSYQQSVAKAGLPSKSWMAKDNTVSKARWLLDDMDVDVSFVRDSGAIKLISLSPEPVQTWRIPALPRPDLPTPAQLTELFGQSLPNLNSNSMMNVFDLSACEDKINHYKEADFSKQYGLELYFRPGKEFDQNQYAVAPTTDELCLSGVRYRNDLDFSSNGYVGPLPWGLELDDTPDSTNAKAPGEPTEQLIDPEDGYQQWQTQVCDVHILYSYLEDRIYRVTLLARGP